MDVSRLGSLMVATSDRRKCRKDGYRIHQTSVGGSCRAAADMKATAPRNCMSKADSLVDSDNTLSDPDVGMV
jgi:hypothetical protein